MSAGRNAPATGYTFGNKKQYRRNVWSAFSEMMCNKRKSAICVLMPSSEGREIDVALQRGFLERNLIIIDKNPAIVATLKRRYRQVRAIGKPLWRAAEDLDPDTIDVANFDLCGPIGDSSTREIEPWITRRIFRDFAAVSVTVLRGREQASGKKWLVSGAETTHFYETWKSRTPDSILAEARPADSGRLAWVANTLSGSRMPSINYTPMSEAVRRPYMVFHNDGGHYTSSCGQSFLWSLYRLHRMPCLCDDCFARFAIANGVSFLNVTLHGVVEAAMAQAWGMSEHELRERMHNDPNVLGSMKKQVENASSLMNMSLRYLHRHQEPA